MKSSSPAHITLAAYVDNLQAQGRYSFTRVEALTTQTITEKAFKNALNRLIHKGRLIKPRNEFYVIVPLEYKNTGGRPPSWYIHDLMKFQNQDYYVGLLSAAALYGAAHQQPQEFQVITNKPLRPIITSRYSIRFFTKGNMENSARRRIKLPTGEEFSTRTQIKVPTGYMEVSTPETTALDLIRYIEAVGYLNNAATVLVELIEKLDAKKLLWSAQAAMCGDKVRKEFSIPQRLGYLLDYVGGEEKTNLLAEWIGKEKPAYTSLDPQKPHESEVIDSKWRIYVNEKIEADL